MKHIATAALLGALISCTTQTTPSNPPGAKSVFALQPADFTVHDTASITSTSGACVGGQTVVKGDLLYVTASGTVTSQLGTIGPEGNGWNGGNPFVFMNRPAFALFGKVSNSVLPIGREGVIIAPESGQLCLQMNTCVGTSIDGGPSDSCDVTGSFSATIHSKLADGVTLATNPPLTDNTIASTSTFSLDTAGNWQGTGVTLQKGQKVFITSTGTFVKSGSIFGTQTLDADGATNGVYGGNPFLMPNTPAWRLMGRVDGNVVQLGTSSAFLSPAAGQLELTINHFTPADTSGSISVSIGQGVVPARGLMQTEPATFAQQQTLTVQPNGDWHGTTLTVSRGDPIVSTATGLLSGSSLDGEVVGAWGRGWWGGMPFPLPNRPILGLFGKVGTQTFFLGAGNAVLAPADGEVELLVNQPTNCLSRGCVDGGFDDTCIGANWCDVSGSFSVSLSAP